MKNLKYILISIITHTLYMSISSAHANDTPVAVTNTLKYSSETKYYSLELSIKNTSNHNLSFNMHILHDSHYRFDFYQKTKKLKIEPILAIQDFMRKNLYIAPNKMLKRSYDLSIHHPKLNTIVTTEAIRVKWSYDISDIMESPSLKTKTCPSGKYKALGEFLLTPKWTYLNKAIPAKVTCIN